MKGCTCEFKRKMMAQMLELRRNPLDGKRNWASLLFENDPDESLCCLLTFLFYCAYCKPCTISLSEEARAVLKPLMEPSE